MAGAVTITWLAPIFQESESCFWRVFAVRGLSGVERMSPALGSKVLMISWIMWATVSLPVVPVTAMIFISLAGLP